MHEGGSCLLRVSLPGFQLADSHQPPSLPHSFWKQQEDRASKEGAGLLSGAAWGLLELPLRHYSEVLMRGESEVVVRELGVGL